MGPLKHRMMAINSKRNEKGQAQYVGNATSNPDAKQEADHNFALDGIPYTLPSRKEANRDSRSKENELEILRLRLSNFRPSDRFDGWRHEMVILPRGQGWLEIRVLRNRQIAPFNRHNLSYVLHRVLLEARIDDADLILILAKRYWTPYTYVLTPQTLDALSRETRKQQLTYSPS